MYSTLKLEIFKKTFIIIFQSFSKSEYSHFVRGIDFFLIIYYCYYIFGWLTILVWFKLFAYVVLGVFVKYYVVNLPTILHFSIDNPNVNAVGFNIDNLRLF